MLRRTRDFTLAAVKESSAFAGSISISLLVQPDASLLAAITDSLLAASKLRATEAITMSLIDPESAPVKKEHLNVRVQVYR